MLAFLKASQGADNHFRRIAEGATQALPERGGGLIWILKYFFLIMPVLFTVYWVAVLYLFSQARKSPAAIGAIFISLCSFLLVEVSQVAQFGRNYFSWLIGMIYLLGYALNHFLNYYKPWIQRNRKLALAVFIIFLAGHVAWNARIFFGDVYPSRMGTKYIADWLLDHPDKLKYVYRKHGYNVAIVNILNNPRRNPKFTFNRIDSIAEAQDGYILVPGITHKSILINCTGKDFSRDPELTRLMASGRFHDFVLASFPTLSSSRVWAQEEEYCAYRDLCLGEISDADRSLGYAWLLDAEKLQREWFGRRQKP